MATADEQLRIEANRAAFWVRHYAREHTLSLNALAVYAGVGASSISQMKNRAPSLRTLSAIAAYLGIQVGDLIKPTPDEAVHNDG